MKIKNKLMRFPNGSRVVERGAGMWSERMTCTQRFQSGTPTTRSRRIPCNEVNITSMTWTKPTITVHNLRESNEKINCNFIYLFRTCLCFQQIPAFHDWFSWHCIRLQKRDALWKLRIQLKQKTDHCSQETRSKTQIKCLNYFNVVKLWIDCV